nr:zinc finger CCCH domain-containing protein 13-like [Penaeus vannamei]
MADSLMTTARCQVTRVARRSPRTVSLGHLRISRVMQVHHSRSSGSFASALSRDFEFLCDVMLRVIIERSRNRSSATRRRPIQVREPNQRITEHTRDHKRGVSESRPKQRDARRPRDQNRIREKQRQSRPKETRGDHQRTKQKSERKQGQRSGKEKLERLERPITESREKAETRDRKREAETARAQTESERIREVDLRNSSKQRPETQQQNSVEKQRRD